MSQHVPLIRPTMLTGPTVAVNGQCPGSSSYVSPIILPSHKAREELAEAVRARTKRYEAACYANWGISKKGDPPLLDLRTFNNPTVIGGLVPTFYKGWQPERVKEHMELKASIRRDEAALVKLQAKPERDLWWVGLLLVILGMLAGITLLVILAIALK